MRHSYLALAILLSLAGQRVRAQATAWRPFRPGFTYSFLQQRGTDPTVVHTLRVDSTYATTAGDSVYAFNRLLRVSGAYVKSRHNLLGARLRWHPGSSDYYLEADAEPALGSLAAAVSLLLRPRAAVGSTWVASTQPALTATLSSRVLGQAATTPDSLATITLSSGQTLLLSRRYGLLQGPQWLTLAPAGAALPAQWQQYGLPRAGLGLYDPRALFMMQVGDEVGYTLQDAFNYGPLACVQGYRLRRVVGRQQTADSLLISYKEQDRVTTFSSPNCPTTSPGTSLSPVRQGRWAFSLRTGASPQFPFLALLIGEYRTLSSNHLAMGQQYLLQPNGGFCLDDGVFLRFQLVYSSGQNAQYSPGLDALAVSQTFAPSIGMGPNSFVDAYANYLAYFRRGSTSCGQPANFAGLLPTRAALAAATATLAPNPAAEAATLTLTTPTLPGTTLALTDALGRRVWSQPVAAGQTTLAVPLAGQNAGLYLVQLLPPQGSYLTWKLTKHD